MAEVFSLVTYKRYAVIFRDGDDAACFYIIKQGAVTIHRLVKALDHAESDNLGPGDLFGIEAVMASRPHFDNAIAKTDCVLVAVKQEQFKQLIQNNGATAIKIALQLSQRIRFLNELLASNTKEPEPLADPAAVDGDTLYLTGDYYYKRQMYNEASYAWRKYVQSYPDGAYAAKVKTDLSKFEDKVTIPQVDSSDDDFIRKYSKGSVICMDGEISSEIFIIQKGRVKITKIIDDKEILLSQSGAGEMFGEMALLESKPRSANVIAVDPCELMVLSKDKFESSIARQPQIVIRLTMLLSERVWYMSRQIRASAIPDLAARCCEMLAIHLEKQNAYLNTASHTFDFTPEMLAEMCLITGQEVQSAMVKLIHEDILALADNNIVVKNKFELMRCVKLYGTLHPLK
ncbi:MAG: cyclic nucleotide-binding domain-containing protein [Spirochaetaceae bacterium]|jgi:CRP-like cAMP-binding protein|nr:cyclic nucleotide-binding domain-containing protein [Spirochaetaceae bacterium]